MITACACPLCGRSIEEIRRTGHALYRDRPNEWMYTGRCLLCDVDFRSQAPNGVARWEMDAPDATQLMAGLTSQEVTALTARLKRYKILGAQWTAFLGRQRPGDEIWRYARGGGPTAIAIVRGKIPIHCYTTFVDL